MATATTSCDAVAGIDPAEGRVSAPAVQPDSAELIEIIHKYNEATEHLKRSHEQLSLEVCRLRKALHAKNQELQRREQLAVLGEMAAGVAHEVRNPLGGIGIYASLLERDLQDRPKERDLCRKIGEGVRSLEAVVGDILTFAGHAAPSPVEVSVGDIFEQVRSQAEPTAAARAVALEVDDKLAAVVLCCDAHQVIRALSNLVFNALDVAPSGGHVWVSGHRGRESAGGGSKLFYLRVEDDGPGIARDLLQRVFTPFFTTKHKGTGLGLAIVHRIAESHQGVARAGNRAEGGAVFELGIPLA